MSLLQRLFTRAPELPAPRPGAVKQAMLWLIGSPVETQPIKTREQMLSAYAGWVYAAASTLAQDVRANPWAMWRRVGRRREDWEQVEEVPPIFRRPNGLQTWGDFIELTQLHLDLAGEAYWHIITGNGNRVQGVQLVYPHWVEQPLMDANGRITGWRVAVPGRAHFVLPAEDVVFLRYPHPMDPLKGASPVEAFALSHDMDIYSRAYSSTLLKNRATPELVISSEQELDPEQSDQIRENWVDRYRDPRNGPAVLGRGAKVQAVGVSLRDMEFAALANLSRDQILAIYKVPAAKVGLTTDFNRANAESADATYKENAVLPRLRRIEEAINTYLLPRLYPAREAERLYYEFENPVDDDREFVLRRAETMLRMGAITYNRFRDMLGEDPLDGEGEVYSLPLGIKLVDKLEAGAGGPEPLPEPEPQQEDAERSQGPRRQPRALHPSAAMELAELRFLRAQDPLERSLRSEARAIFTREQKAVMARLRQEGLRAVETRDWVDDVLKESGRDWDDTLRQYIERGLREGWLLFGAEVGDSIAFDIYQQEAVAFARRRAGAAVTEITETTRLGVRQVITEAVERGHSLDATLRNIAELYDGFKGQRAQVIARTETAMAVNAGKEAHASEIESRLGIELLKTWVATADERTRESHLAANGQTVRRGEPFEVGGAYLQHPGDPNGPGREIIQCRCTMVFSEVGDD